MICSWRQIDDDLPAPWIISRGDSAIRSYGFWKAWSIGADYIFTLDDDCFPVDRDHVTRHLDNLEATPAWHSTVDGLRVRGLPYSNVGTLRNIRVSTPCGWVTRTSTRSRRWLAAARRPTTCWIEG